MLGTKNIPSHAEGIFCSEGSSVTVMEKTSSWNGRERERERERKAKRKIGRLRAWSTPYRSRY
jgi:hypothetical protein